MDLASVADDPDGDRIGPGSAWAALAVERQRSVMAAVLERVVIHPSRRRNQWDASRIELVRAAS